MKKIQTKFTNLYSKFKRWVKTHKTASLTITVLILLAVAAIAILIGGSIAGWDIVGFFTSPTFGLILAIGCLAAISAVMYFIGSNRR